MSGGELGAFIFTTLMGAAFLLLAVKFRQGKWLNFIAGNNFVTKEEMNAPYQRALGKRTALVMVAAAIMAFATSALALGEGFGNEALRIGGIAACVLSVVALLIGIISLQAWALRCAKTERERRLEAARRAGGATAAVAEEDAKLDKRQTVVVFTIIICITVITLVIGFLPRS